MKAAWIAVVILAVGVGCAPQGPAEEEMPMEGAGATAAEMEAARTAVEGVVAGIAESFMAQDWPAAQALITDDWAFYSNMGQTDFAGLRQFFEDHITDHTIDFSVTDVVVAGDGAMAWASWDETTSYTFDGEPLEENGVFTGLFESTDDGWRMSRMHRTVVQPMEEESAEM